MATVIGLVIFIGAIAALWALNKAVGKTTNAASRAVFRKSYDAGRAQMKRSMSFSAPTSVEALADRIVAVVNAHPQAPAVVGGLYLYQRSESLIVFALGSKVNPATFRARVDLRPTPTGASGSFRVVDWSESGATVIGRETVDRLITRISKAVHDLSGSVERT